MELANILAKDSVVICQNVRNKRELIEILAEKAANQTGRDKAEVLEALLKREELGSTALGNGIAIPHGKLSGLKGVVAAFARLDTAVEFDSPDDQKVDLVMMLLAPIGAGADHLKALARVARLLRTDSLVHDLRRSTSPDQIHALLTAPIEATFAA